MIIRFRKVLFITLITPMFLLGCKKTLEKPILIIQKFPDYIINIKINKYKKNRYYGELLFANISGKSINMLNLIIPCGTLHVCGNIVVSHNIKQYHVISDVMASHFDMLIPNKIERFNIYIDNIPENFKWEDARIVVSAKDTL